MISAGIAANLVRSSELSDLEFRFESSVDKVVCVEVAVVIWSVKDILVGLKVLGGNTQEISTLLPCSDVLVLVVSKIVAPSGISKRARASACPNEPM